MSIVCTLRSPSETRRSRILPADAPGAKGFLSLSIRTATPPRAPTEQPAPGEPGCGSPDLRGLRAQASRLGSVACYRVTFYHSFDKRLVEAFTFKLVPRQWTETRSGLPGGRRKDGPAVTQGRGRSPPPPGGDTGCVAETGPRFPWPRRAARGPAELAGPARSPRPLPAPTPRPLRPHLSKRTVGKEPRDTQSGPRASPGGFRRERQEHRPRAARGVFRFRGRRNPWHRAGCVGRRLSPGGSLWGCGLCPPRATALSARVSVSVSTPRPCR